MASFINFCLGIEIISEGIQFSYSLVISVSTCLLFAVLKQAV